MIQYPMRSLCYTALSALFALTLHCGSDNHSSDGHTHDPDGGVGPLTDARDLSDAQKMALPEKLSQTGLFANIQTKALASDVVPYNVRYQLWSDGMEKYRYISLPPGTAINTQDPNHWTAPVGTKLWKEFRKNNKRIETRFQQKILAGDGASSWVVSAYLWKDDESDAVAVPEGVASVPGIPYPIPSVAECRDCHAQAKDIMIGLDPFQLSTGGADSTLKKFAAKQWLSNGPTEEISPPGTSLEQNALGYLHGNCGYCHGDVGAISERRAMRLRLFVGEKSVKDTLIYKTTINQPVYHGIDGTSVVIKPGQPKSSQMIVRMNRRDAYQMPPLGTNVVDGNAVQLITDWINTL